MQRVLGLDSDVDAMMICVDEPLRLVGGGKRRDIAQVEVNMGTLANRLDKLDHKFGLIEREVAAIAAMTEEFVHNTASDLSFGC
eukprot:g28492.t1